MQYSLYYSPSILRLYLYPYNSDLRKETIRVLLLYISSFASIGFGIAVVFVVVVATCLRGLSYSSRAQESPYILGFAYTIEGSHV